VTGGKAPAPAPAQGQPPAGDGEAGRVQALDARFAQIENEQREQRGILDKIAAAVGQGGSGGGAPAGGQGDGGQGAGAGPVPSAASIAAQVRQEIADADQRRKAEEDDKTWRAGVNEVVEKIRAEQQPRPPQTGLAARVRRVVLGKDWDA
jgi:hypothetical protein